MNPPEITDIEVEAPGSPAALDSLRRTVEAMGAYLIERNGRFYVSTLNSGYMRFALAHQGYARLVEETA